MNATPHQLDVVDKKYPGWRKRVRKAYISIGEQNDMHSLQVIENSYMVIVPYNILAIGAVQGGHEDMLLHALSKGTFVSHFGFALSVFAKKYENEHLYDALITYFGEDVFENKY
jgi:hypothetical protein